MISDRSAASEPAGSSLPHLATHQPGTSVACSVMQPCGDGVRDVRFILGPPSTELSRWYDTYDGHPDATPDWYAIELPQPEDLNTIFFVHGPMVPVGGWWKSLEFQYLDDAEAWQNIQPWTITPSYSFEDERGNRQPFEPFLVSFPTVRTRGIRLIGTPGGSLGVTTIAYLAAGYAMPAEAEAYLQQLRRPLPQVFSFLPPNNLWDLIASIRNVTQIAFDVQSREGLGLDHFLDAERYKQFHAHDTSVYDQTSLYQLIGTHEGWDQFGLAVQAARQQAIDTQQPVIYEHHGGMVWLVVPVVVNGETIGTIENRNLVARDRLDSEWHRAAPQRLDIDREQYAAAAQRIPVLETVRLEAIVALLSQILSLAQQQVHQRIEVTELRSTVEELAVPILPVWPGVLMVPLIGQIDEQRVRQMSETVLQGIWQHRTHTVLIDITGVLTLDPGVVGSIARLAQATKLLGATCFLCGVRPEVAVTLGGTGVPLGSMRTFATLQTALAMAISGRGGPSELRAGPVR